MTDERSAETTPPEPDQESCPACGYARTCIVCERREQQQQEE
jgi:hypothetical protein